jgi:MFS family permease
MNEHAVENIQECAMTMTAEVPARVVPLRRNWRFQLIWLGSTASFLGLEAADVAYPVAILALTGSPGQAAAFGFVQLVASLLSGLPAGDWADRHDTRRLLLLAEGVRAVVTAGIALTYALGGHVGMAHFLVAAAVLGAAQPFGGTARMLLIREVVPAEQLTAALTQEQVRNGVAALAGPPIGGALYGLKALRHGLPFVFSAATFVLSAVCAFFVRVPARAATPPEPAASGPAASGPAASGPVESVAHRMLAGVRTLWRDPALRAATLLVIAINTIGGPLALVTVVILRGQGVPPGVVGLALAGGAVGSLAGSLLVGPLHRLRPGVLLIGFAAFVIPLLAGLALPYGPWWVATVLMLASLGIPALQVLVDVLILRKVPAAERGRTIGAVMTLFTLGMPVGTVYAGLLLQYLSAPTAVLVLAGTLALAALYCAAKPELRHATWH